MKKLMKAKPSSRRDFLRKSALGVASAGFLGADILQESGKESQIPDTPTENQAASMQTKTRHVRPVRTETGKKKVDVIHAKDQEEIQWEAPDDTDIAIMFPPGRDPANVGTEVVRAGLASRVFTVTDLRKGDKSKKPSETYRYCVYCYATNEYAQGNSEPELIVP